MSTKNKEKKRWETNGNVCRMNITTLRIEFLASVHLAILALDISHAWVFICTRDNMRIMICK